MAATRPAKLAGSKPQIHGDLGRIHLGANYDQLSREHWDRSASASLKSFFHVPLRPIRRGTVASCQIIAQGLRQ